ncbi:hypothetical protein HAX54_004159 [Datura stramonium]|uniref:Uncharacterized protein n=1 Tax=Datura stramonium TaxID=4076 RepID=A0ABS8WSQ2_DATST|nr:hypothetical protein [Datura stramonium]
MVASPTSNPLAEAVSLTLGGSEFVLCGSQARLLTRPISTARQASMPMPCFLSRASLRVHAILNHQCLTSCTVMPRLVKSPPSLPYSRPWPELATLVLCLGAITHHD